MVSEGLKWTNYTEASVEIHNADFTDSFTTTISSISSNVMTVDAAPSFTVTDGNYFIRLSNYSDQENTIKLIFAFLSDDINNFSDGGTPYVVI